MIYMQSKVSILISTYNGEKYLKEQLDSLFAQKYNNFHIIVRDDISTDSTLEILKSYDLKIIQSKSNLGAKGSFSTLLEYALNNSNSKYFMFCDQDDIWSKDKIENTLAKMHEMEKLNSQMPILVHTDLKVADEDLNILNDSFMSYQSIDAKYVSLNNLLIQNNITGCTVMINLKLAKMCLPVPKESIMHDWWIGLVASKFGKIGFLDETTMLYRQHSTNDTGAKKFNSTNTFKKALRLFFSNKLYIKYLRRNIIQSKAFLDRYKNNLDDKTISMLEDFINIENKSFWQKREILLKYKLLKQGFIRNLGLLLKI